MAPLGCHDGWGAEEGAGHQCSPGEDEEEPGGHSERPAAPIRWGWKPGPEGREETASEVGGKSMYAVCVFLQLTIINHDITLHTLRGGWKEKCNECKIPWSTHEVVGHSCIYHAWSSIIFFGMIAGLQLPTVVIVNRNQNPINFGRLSHSRSLLWCLSGKIRGNVKQINKEVLKVQREK